MGFVGAGSTKAEENTIIFNQTKKEAFILTTHFKEITRRLKTSWKFVVNKDEITTERLSFAKLFVIAGAVEKFSAAEFQTIKKYIENGGAVLVLMGENGESKYTTNINFLLEQYGIMVNSGKMWSVLSDILYSDAVVRTSYYKYFHPKEALIPNGILNRAIAEAAGKNTSVCTGEDISHKMALQFLYPYGATLNVAKPSVALLSTGSVAFPLNRPVCAIHMSKGNGSGSLGVVGSAAMFTDSYVTKEDNFKVFEVLLNLLTTDSITLNAIDAEDPEIETYHQVPDITSLANSLKSCLQESDEIPQNIAELFDQSLFNMDLSLVPHALNAYEKLQVKHEPLSLITPQFETPLPPIQPAVFPPNFREPGPPALELFDLEEQFSTPKARLAQVTNKCTEDDLEYFVRECGDILGVSRKIPTDKRNARVILEVIFNELVEFKKSNQD
ncbi:Intraflagellar transport protein [Paragonimus westermani]|uniref:Intraflagellar transport protein n=1 Tax=Paragonimus westermani TaxID=34504 RepID=A0A8T0D8K8_9TREM|nr:Intraflagellar transport protein [Paragonimus westermani]